MKSMLITGASGFVGRALKEVINKDKYVVITTDIAGSVDYLGDLSERDFVESLPDVDHVVHLAGVQYVTPQRPVFGRRQWFIRNNVAATEFLSQRFQDAHFIYVATSMVFDQHRGQEYSSNSVRKASGDYSESKLSAVRVVEYMKKYAIVYPCIIVGKGRGGLFGPLLRALRYARTLLYSGDYNQKISVIDVRDVARILNAIVMQSFVGHVTIAGEDPSSVLAWSEVAADHLGIAPLLRIRLPMLGIAAFARLTGYRFVFREQMSMLQYGHIVKAESMEKLGVRPLFTTSDSIRALAGMYR